MSYFWSFLSGLSVINPIFEFYLNFISTLFELYYMKSTAVHVAESLNKMDLLWIT